MKGHFRPQALSHTLAHLGVSGFQNQSTWILLGNCIPLLAASRGFVMQRRASVGQTMQLKEYFFLGIWHISASLQTSVKWKQYLVLDWGSPLKHIKTCEALSPWIELLLLQYSLSALFSSYVLISKQRPKKPRTYVLSIMEAHLWIPFHYPQCWLLPLVRFSVAQANQFQRIQGTVRKTTYKELKKYIDQHKSQKQQTKHMPLGNLSETHLKLA